MVGAVICQIRVREDDIQNLMPIKMARKRAGGMCLSDKKHSTVEYFLPKIGAEKRFSPTVCRWCSGALDGQPHRLILVNKRDGRT